MTERAQTAMVEVLLNPQPAEGSQVNCHPNARLAPKGRVRVFEAVEGGMTITAACIACGVSRRWYYRWLPRWRAQGPAGLVDASSRPWHSPRQLSQDQLESVRALRQSTGWGPDRIGARLGLHASTVHRAIRRLGLNAPKPAPTPVIRYVYQQPGGLVHLDIKKLGRMGVGPGHRVTGDRHQHGRLAVKGYGWEFLYVALDDASRLVYTEVLRDEMAETGAFFLRKAHRWFDAQSIKVERILTDNGTAFRNNAIADVCRELGIRHIFTRPYRPQTNGKVERWIRTVLSECLYLEVFNSRQDRLLALERFLRYYNDQRPHLGLAGLPPRRFLEMRLAS